MIVLFRALTYATLFIGLLLVFVPDRILAPAGIVRPATIGLLQILAMLVIVAGAGLAIASILTFAFIGKGTPAPFDPPRKLVVAGPYRWVRNPMYIGAGLVLLGAAMRSEEHTSELQSHSDIVCRLLLEQKNLCERCVIEYNETHP